MAWRRLAIRRPSTRCGLVAQAQPSRFHPQMKVEYSGAIAMALAEQRAVRDDLSLASGLCAALVLLSIFCFFRRFTVLLAVGAPAVLGCCSRWPSPTHAGLAGTRTRPS